jgi:polar amino acid transport system substrate-binding protein
MEKAVIPLMSGLLPGVSSKALKVSGELRYYLGMNAFRIILLALLFSATAHAQSLVVLVDTSTEMPMADVRNGRLLGGIHRDLAEALAYRMGRKLETIVLPRKRIGLALESGRADMICLYKPEWLPGPYQWTQAFFPHAELVLTAHSAPAPQSLADLSGRPIGTVLGFEYPDLEQALGAGFVREDGPSNLTNLRKLAAGRVQHVATIKYFYDYQQRQREPIKVHPPLLVKQYLTRCAVSQKGRVSLADVDAVLTQLVRDGVIAKILATYQ